MPSLHTLLLLGLVASAAALEAPRKAITLTPQAAPLRHEVEKHTGLADALCDKMTSVEVRRPLPREWLGVFECLPHPQRNRSPPPGV